MAILLVLGNHSTFLPQTTGPLAWLHWHWIHFGWTGVDLFFVLSGFLIGGLLFAEIGTRSHLDVRRFLVRRGFKIWPSYFLLLLYVGVQQLGIKNLLHPGGHALQERLTHLQAVLPNLLHVQNYLGTPRLHTWSLAVEEHFYVLLPVLLWGMARRPKFLRQIPLVAILLIIGCTALRCLTRWLNPSVAPEWLLMYPTHLRVDGLFFGVLLAYLNARDNRLAEYAARHYKNLLCAGALLVSPIVFLDYKTAPFVTTGGLTLLYLGYGMLLLGTLYMPVTSRLKGLVTGPAGRVVSFVGFYSYSIYLWHLDGAVEPGEKLTHLVRFLPANAAWLVSASAYILLAVIVGVLLARAVEVPSLKIRERWFPARGKALTP